MNKEKGTIYLIQPAELVGTERYKIGCSAKNDLERCKKGYKKGTRFMDIRECDDPFAVEREVKNHFNIKFKLIAGKEYFEGNEMDIKKEFNDVVCKFTSLKRDDSDDDIYFKFKSKGISVNPLLPKSKALFNPPYTNNEQDPFQISSSILTDYEVDCRDNFNKEEQTIIKKYNIQSLDDLLRCESIPSYDKARALKCYKYVCDRNELMGIEPFNGNTSIQICKYMFNIKISFDKIVKFIQSCGIRTHDDYYTFQIEN
jgi:hypothetical protein